MAYVATRGGERAITQSERLYRAMLGRIDKARVESVAEALPMLVDRVMGEASLYEPELAALALSQTGGDLYETVLLLRAWRSTQPRIAVARPVRQEQLFTHRRISAAFKDIPGGQILGPTLDYSHRILETGVLEDRAAVPAPVTPAEHPAPAHHPSLADWQRAQGLLETKHRDEVAPEDMAPSCAVNASRTPCSLMSCIDISLARPSLVAEAKMPAGMRKNLSAATFAGEPSFGFHGIFDLLIQSAILKSKSLVSTDSGLGPPRAPLSSASIAATSSAVSPKSRMSKFSAMRAGRTDFGMAEKP